MIITRTPFRVSFCGGGTDFKEFYRQEFGCVVSAAIDKFIYLTLNAKFAGDIRVGYSKTEIVKTPEEIQHPIAREALKLLGVAGVEAMTTADVLAGTGLGSSASFTVGLLNALYSYQGESRSPGELAKEAGYIERELAHEIAGKQDYYIAAHGGLLYIQFNSDESTTVEAINYRYLTELNDSLMLVYTGPRKEKAASILEEQTTSPKLDALKEIKNLTLKLRSALIRSARPEVLGEILNKSWIIKRGLASGISTPEIDDYYSRALEAGAVGGKLCGAGGGGFLLLYCPKEKQEGVGEALGLQVMPFSFEATGSQIIYNDIRGKG